MRGRGGARAHAPTDPLAADSQAARAIVAAWRRGARNYCYCALAQPRHPRAPQRHGTRGRAQWGQGALQAQVCRRLSQLRRARGGARRRGGRAQADARRGRRQRARDADAGGRGHLPGLRRRAGQPAARRHQGGRARGRGLRRAGLADARQAGGAAQARRAARAADARLLRRPRAVPRRRQLLARRARRGGAQRAAADQPPSGALAVLRRALRRGAGPAAGHARGRRRVRVERHL